jgi:hypothetical protein
MKFLFPFVFIILFEKAWMTVQEQRSLSLVNRLKRQDYLFLTKVKNPR